MVQVHPGPRKGNNMFNIGDIAIHKGMNLRGTIVDVYSFKNNRAYTLKCENHIKISNLYAEDLMSDEGVAVPK